MRYFDPVIALPDVLVTIPVPFEELVLARSYKPGWENCREWRRKRGDRVLEQVYLWICLRLTWLWYVGAEGQPQSLLTYYHIWHSQIINKHWRVDIYLFKHKQPNRRRCSALDLLRKCVKILFSCKIRWTLNLPPCLTSYMINFPKDGALAHPMTRIWEWQHFEPYKGFRESRRQYARLNVQYWVPMQRSVVL